MMHSTCSFFARCLARIGCTILSFPKVWRYIKISIMPKNFDNYLGIMLDLLTSNLLESSQQPDSGIGIPFGAGISNHPPAPSRARIWQPRPCLSAIVRRWRQAASCLTLHGPPKKLVPRGSDDITEDLPTRPQSTLLGLEVDVV